MNEGIIPLCEALQQEGNLFCGQEQSTVAGEINLDCTEGSYSSWKTYSVSEYLMYRGVCKSLGVSRVNETLVVRPRAFPRYLVNCTHLFLSLSLLSRQCRYHGIDYFKFRR